MSAITTGAPKMAVTALMESSTGENSVRAIKSQPAQKMAPPKKHAGITRMGFDDFSADFTRYGTAMPTNDTGPANAVTQAESMLARRTSTTRKRATFTPTLFA